MTTLRQLALSAATLGALTVTGCSFNAGADKPINADSHARYDRYDDDRGREAGLREIPRTAFVVAEGHQRKDFVARDDGQVFVLDTDNGDVILRHHIDRGDRFSFDPDHNKAYVNDHKIYDRDINSHHVYRIYFDDGRDRDYHDRYYRDRY